MKLTDPDYVVVVEHLRLLHSDKPYFKSVGIDKDDAGSLVEMKVTRAKLPPEGIKVKGAINGIRVCVVTYP